jgi:Flp pilus assembly protein protease CpaA
MTIPNRLSLLLVAGFAAFALVGGLPAQVILLHLGAGAAVLAATFALFAFGWIGGGDAKLAAATALWLGFDILVQYLFIASLAGGALTLGILATAAAALRAALGLALAPARAEGGRALRHRARRRGALRLSADRALERPAERLSAPSPDPPLRIGSVNHNLTFGCWNTRRSTRVASRSSPP